MSDVSCPSCGEDGAWNDFQDSEETSPDLANYCECPSCGHSFEAEPE